MEPHVKLDHLINTWLAEDMADATDRWRLAGLSRVSLRQPCPHCGQPMSASVPAGSVPVEEDALPPSGLL